MAYPAQATRMPPPPYFVNFSSSLETLMRESKYLDRMGFTIPEKALNVTLQRPKFLEYVQLLNGMLDKYHSLLSDLKPFEANLLQVWLPGWSAVHGVRAKRNRAWTEGVTLCCFCRLCTCC